MTKRKPVIADNSKRGPSAQRSAASRSSSLHIQSGKPHSKGKKNGKKQHRRNNRVEEELPVWCQRLITALTACALLVGAYMFLIRPYSYRWKPCRGSKAYDVCMPQGFDVFGIDVSHHQGDVDWENVAKMSDKGYPLRFAVIKATEGGDFKDSNFDVNYKTARECGLACGAYLFYNPGTSPSIQASYYMKNVSLAKGDLPPVVDIEHKGKSPVRLREDLRECLMLLEEHYGVKPIIYTSYKFWKHYLDVPEFEKYKFWIAHYYIDDPDEDVNWTIWQFTDRGTVTGIGGYVDLNVFNGSYDSFRRILIE